jgi:hypothetical protein
MDHGGEVSMGAEVQATVPTFDELLWPTIKALKVMGGSASNEELCQAH